MITEEDKQAIQDDVYCLKSMGYMSDVIMQFNNYEIDEGLFDRYIKIKERKFGKELIELITEVRFILLDAYKSENEIEKITSLFERYNGKFFDAQSAIQFEIDVNNLINELENNSNEA